MKRAIPHIEDFEGTSIGEDVGKVYAFYSDIEHDFDDFQAEFGIRCPSVCGHCCENFIPDVTYLEALAIAYELFAVQGRDMSWVEGWSRTHKGCPLFNTETKRCLAYFVRPVVCRVFCSAASRLKNGLSFRGCRLSEKPDEMVAFLDDKALSSSSVPVPVMDEYGEKIRSLNEFKSETKLLDEAIPDIIGKLSLIRGIRNLAI